MRAAEPCALGQVLLLQQDHSLVPTIALVEARNPDKLLQCQNCISLKSLLNILDSLHGRCYTVVCNTCTRFSALHALQVLLSAA